MSSAASPSPALPSPASAGPLVTAAGGSAPAGSAGSVPAGSVPAGSVPAGSAGPGGRAGWHRRTGLLPLAYLAGIVVVGLVHPVLPQWRWLAIHLLLLGAISNAIVIWSGHFTAAVLRAPAPASRRGEAARLSVLNAGVLGVLAGGTLERPWVGVAGAVAVFAAIGAHLWWLRARLRAALPTPLRVTVHYYLAAATALLTGIPVGAWMLVADDAARSRLLLFHAHINLLGWVALTVLGTVLTLWPTVLRTRMAAGAARAARTALPVVGAGLALLALGVLAWLPALAGGGLALVAAGVLLVGRPAVQAARRRPPASFAAWSIAAGAAWLLVALGIDAATLLVAGSADDAAGGFGRVLLPLLVGFAAQILLGALSYLLPVVLGGGPARVRAATAALERHGPRRVVMANLALAVFLLPVPPYVRIATSLLVLAALVQFVIPAARLVLASRRPVATGPASPPAGTPAASAPAPGAAAFPPAGPPAASVPAPAGRLGGVAAGVALVLFATVAGVVAEHAADPRSGPVAAGEQVPATGNTTTVAITADGMRFHPDRIAVPAGDRLVVEVTNQDSRRHDLVLATGVSTGPIGRGETVIVDAGVVGGTVDGWCSLPGHRQAGMTLTIAATGAADGGADGGAEGGSAAGGGHHPAGPAAGDRDAPPVDPMADPGAGFTARDATAPATTPSGRVHRIDLRAQEVVREVAPGVRQRLWTFNGTAPGPVLRGQVGDTFEITLSNDGSVDHGIDFHASALAPDAAMRPVEPGERLTYRFTADQAGIWMYHCSTMPMLLHVGNGMYGAVIIDPPDLAPVAREYVLVQSEFYLGPQGEIGDLAVMQADQPDLVVFNGYADQYRHRPLPATAGERVRIWVLDAGPNRASAFHVVGARFDTVYREGNYELRPDGPGGAQVLDLAPATGGFVETVFAEPGHYPFVSHVLVDAARGASGSVTVTGADP